MNLSTAYKVNEIALQVIVAREEIQALPDYPGKKEQVDALVETVNQMFRSVVLMIASDIESIQE